MKKCPYCDKKLNITVEPAKNTFGVYSISQLVDRKEYIDIINYVAKALMESPEFCEEVIEKTFTDKEKEKLKEVKKRKLLERHYNNAEKKILCK